MTLLVDDARYPAHGRLWAHLASDSSLAELHAFAAVLGLPPGAFEGDHYDVREDRVSDAVQAGALAVGTRELLQRLRAAGLRTPKRRGEKVLATSVPCGAGVLRVDVVRCAQVPAPHHDHVVTTDDGTVVGRVAEVGVRRVLGFRRTWFRTPDGVEVHHEGVLLAGPADVVGSGAPTPGSPSAWWAPLLVATPQASRAALTSAVRNGEVAAGAADPEDRG